MFEFGPSGNVIWSRPLPDAFQPLPNPAVEASPAIGDTGFGIPAIEAGVIGISIYSLDPGTGNTNWGWPQKAADTTFSTAAIANVNGHQQIIAGSDSTGDSPGHTGALNNWDGGSVRSLDANGNTLWTIPNNEVVTSSPAVGNLDGSGPEVVFGHGSWWKQSDSTGLTAASAATGQVLWESHLNGYTPASPALADLVGNGQLDIVEPTSTAPGQSNGGDVYAFRPDGSTLWGPVVLPNPPLAPGNPNTIYGGVATADFGEGYQDVVVGAGFGWDILDGRTGSVVTNQGLGVNWDGNVGNLSMQNTPLVTPDPTGNGVDVVMAGTYSAANGDFN
ncbi:MAG: PQQ-binding-like beta-propeller repeat protein, partial [Acidimicrobiales bacterium]